MKYIFEFVNNKHAFVYPMLVGHVQAQPYNMGYQHQAVVKELFKNSRKFTITENGINSVQ